MKSDGKLDSKYENMRLYCKRKYYQVACLFMNAKNCGPDNIENKIHLVLKEINIVKKLISTHMELADDLLIMLNLHSCYCLMMTRRLISSERDLNIAEDIFEQLISIRQSKRPDIPVLPKCILLQRIMLHKCLILKAYERKQEAARLLTKLLKVGKVYDPLTRMEALDTLLEIFKTHPQGNLLEKYPEAKNIESMAQLFHQAKNKNIVLCVDSLEDDMIDKKKEI